jgi:hypothetical protein
VLVSGALVQETFHDWNFNEGNPFLLEDDFLLCGGCSFDVPLLCLSIMDFESLFVKIGPHIFEMLIKIGFDQLRNLVNIHSASFVIIAPLDHEGGINPLYIQIITDRAVDHPGRFLLLIGGAILKPAFEKMTIGTKEIESNHPHEPPNKEYLTCSPFFDKRFKFPWASTFTVFSAPKYRIDLILE